MKLVCLSVGVAVATVDKLGRRPLLLGGVTGLVLSLLALSGAQGLVKGDAATWVSVVGLLAYTASYQVGITTENNLHPPFTLRPAPCPPLPLPHCILLCASY